MGAEYLSLEEPDFSRVGTIFQLFSPVFALFFRVKWLVLGGL